MEKICLLRLYTTTTIDGNVGMILDSTSCRETTGRGGEGNLKHSRILFDTVKGRMHALAVRELQHALHGVLLLVQDDVVRAVQLRDFCLLGRARRADDRRAARFDELREEQAEPARDGVHEDGVALLYVVCLGDERQRGRACVNSGR